jgi:predicted ATPase
MGLDVAETRPLSTPELNLYFAMICEAIMRVLFEARRTIRSSEWLEDFQWLYSEETRAETSFLRLASLFDIDHEWIREKVYDALARGDTLEAPSLARGRKRCHLAGLLVLDEARARLSERRSMEAA